MYLSCISTQSRVSTVPSVSRQFFNNALSRNGAKNFQVFTGHKFSEVLKCRPCIRASGNAVFSQSVPEPFGKDSASLVNVSDGNGGTISESLLNVDTSLSEFEFLDKTPISREAIMFETAIEKFVYNCRFFASMAVLGALAGSLLCYFKGSWYVIEAFQEYFRNCIKGNHTGQVILLLIEAIDVYLVGTVMLIFGNGLYSLFISGSHHLKDKRAINNSTLFGMFRLIQRPPWMNITSLDEMKTKLGHVIVMILLVGMFEKAKKIHVVTSLDLLAFSGSIVLCSTALFLLHKITS